MKFPKPIKIQIVSNYYPSYFGGSPYLMLDFLNYATQHADIQYVLMDEMSINFLKPKSIPREVDFCVIDNYRLGPFFIARNFSSNLKKMLKIAWQPVKFVLPSDWRAKIKKMMSSFLLKQSLYFAIPNEQKLQSYKILFEKFNPNVVIADYAWIAPIFDVLPEPNKVVKIIIAHDIIHLRANSFKTTGVLPDVPDWNAEQESFYLQKSDIVVVETETEAESISRIAPNVKVVIMPKSWTLVDINDDNQVNGRCLFVGSAAKHNLIGLKWFLERVWPHVLQCVQGAQLHVCGSVCDFLVGELNGKFKNVRLIGRVKDLRKEYEEAAVCIVPLIAGSGFKIKVGEAMSHGRVVVTTTVGAQGVEKLKGKGLIVADDELEFANAVCEMLQNPSIRREYQQRLRTFVLENLTPEKVYGKLFNLIRDTLIEIDREINK